MSMNNICAKCKTQTENNILCDKCVKENAHLFGANNVFNKINSVNKAVRGWAKSGFQTADLETLSVRLETCKGCEFWDKSGFAKTGRCKKCGCSTQAKLRMATEKCPIGKW